MSISRSWFTVLLSASIFTEINTNAQTIPDSLLNKIEHAANDSIKSRAILDAGEALEVSSIDISLKYYYQALELARKIKNDHLILSSLNDIGIACIERNKFDSAVHVLKQTELVAEKLMDTNRMGRITANIGNVYFHQHNRVMAINYYLKGVAFIEKTNNKSGLQALYSNICSLFQEQKEFTKAIEYGNLAKTMSKINNDDFTEVNALLNLSNTYGDLGDRNKQLELLNQALPIAKKRNDIEQIATVYHDLGEHYFQTGNYPASLEQFQHSFTYVKQMANPYHLCMNYNALGAVYFKLGNNLMAMKNIKLAENIADSVGARANLKDIYETRAEIEQKEGNYKTAAAYLVKRINISDSLFRVESSGKVADAEAKYENEKKQKEINQLQNDKALQLLVIRQKEVYNIYLIIVIILIIFLGVIGYRNLRHRQQLSKKNNELQEHQIRELEKDKRLVAVDSMMKGEENERSRLAKDLHDGLGGLLSGVKFTLSNMKENVIITPDNQAVFERSLDMLDASIKELRRVAHNMMPEMLVKFGLDETIKEYCHSINTTGLISIQYQSVGMDTRLDSSMEIIIYRIVQELINNILKHASASEALVQLINEKTRLSLIVEDNGKGFDTSILDTNRAAGHFSIRSRVDYLKGKMEINSEIGKGTLVNIEFNS